MTSEAETGRKAAARDAPISGLGGWVYAAFFFLLPVQGVLAPKSVVVSLLAATLLGLIAAWRSRAARPWTELDRPLAIGLGLLVLWSATASLWSFDPSRSLVLSLRVGGIFLAALMLHALIGGIRRPDLRRRMGVCLVAGLCLALGLMIIELVFGFPLGHAIRGAADLGGDPAVWLNRGATALAILCWPGAAVLWRARSRWAAVTLICVAFGVLCFLSSLAAVVGLAAAALVAAAALAYPKAGRALLVLATLAAVIGSPVLAQKFYEHDWQTAGWLPFSAQHRVEIWHFSLARIAERPLTGWGFDSARAMKHVADDIEASGRSPVALHPHNAPLQIQLELGLAGMVLALGLSWLLIRGLEALPPPERAFGQAGYVATLVVACTSFGMWQNWWLALMCWAAIAIGATGGRPRPAP